ncbi:hypothetical protein UY3_12150 [Chelonia mydas]|uniref:Uncharacterized protein n=1 Tax=Chelonia mydas TaxID=8469 RepID=M7BF39_CHEMY|nr:hypothetical protein UY3_12150 [Chelonia mydas]
MLSGQALSLWEHPPPPRQGGHEDLSGIPPEDGSGLAAASLSVLREKLRHFLLDIRGSKGKVQLTLQRCGGLPLHPLGHEDPSGGGERDREAGHRGLPVGLCHTTASVEPAQLTITGKDPGNGNSNSKTKAVCQWSAISFKKLMMSGEQEEMEVPQVTFKGDHSLWTSRVWMWECVEISYERKASAIYREVQTQLLQVGLASDQLKVNRFKGRKNKVLKQPCKAQRFFFQLIRNALGNPKSPALIYKVASISA